MDVVTTCPPCPTMGGSSTAIVIITFVFILVILGLVIWLVIILVPKTTVALFGACTHQTDCSAGLVCSNWALSVTGTVCLNGVSNVCTINSDCATGLTCQSGVCTSLPLASQVIPNTLSNTSLTNNLMFNKIPMTAVNQFTPIPYQSPNYQSIQTQHALSMQPITSLDQLSDQLVFGQAIQQTQMFSSNIQDKKKIYRFL